MIQEVGPAALPVNNAGPVVLTQGSTSRVQELDDILVYANRFHHDTNKTYETEVVNDGQLLDFVKRTLTWTRG
jgi:hypothetical protein